MSCKKAQGFLEAGSWDVENFEDATRSRRGWEEAKALAQAADKVIVAKGKKIVIFRMKDEPPNDETLKAHLLGPSGNLRAPTLRKGKTMLVGFSEEAYRQIFK